MAENIDGVFWIPNKELSVKERAPRGGGVKPKIVHGHGVTLRKCFEKTNSSFKDYVSKSEKMSNCDPLFILQTETKIHGSGAIAKLSMETIAVLDEKRCIVSTKRSAFENTIKKVNEYEKSKESRYKSIFGDVVKISPNDSNKTSKSVLDSKLSADIVRVRITAISKSKYTNVSGYYDYLDGVLEEKSNVLSRLSLDNGISFICADMDASALSKVTENPAVIFISPVTGITIEDCQFDDYSLDNYSICDDFNLDELETICVLDSGVNFPTKLERFVVAHWRADDVRDTANPHGTMVASKAIFGFIGGRSMELRPRCRIVDCNVYGDKKNNLESMAIRVEAAVKQFYDSIKIFVMSINGDRHHENPMDPLSMKLDELEMKYGVKFVVSTGNNGNYGSSLDETFDDSDSDLLSPANAVCPIAVGAYTGTDSMRSMTKRDEPAPYTCKGPGVSKIRKPDVVAYAGVRDGNRQTIKDEYSRVIQKSGIAYECGTSFSAPFVAGTLAWCRKAIDDPDLMSSVAVLINSSKDTTWRPKQGNIDINNIRGYGVLDDITVKDILKNNAVLIHRGTVKPDTDVELHIPLPEMTVPYRKSERLYVLVTVVSRPYVDRTKGPESVRANIGIHCDNAIAEHNTGQDIWSPVHRRMFTIEKNPESELKLRLSATARADVKGAEIPFALVVTMIDPKGLDVQQHIRLTGRYPNLVSMKEKMKVSRVVV